MANPATDQAKKNAQYAGQEGGSLLDQFGQTQEDQAQNENWYQQQTGDFAQGLMQNGGYTPAEASGVLGIGGEGSADYSAGVPGLNDLSGVSDQESQSDFLTPEEQQSIEGNPGLAANNLTGAFGEEDAQLGYGQGQQNAAVGQEKSDLGAAIDPNQLGVRSGYSGDVQSQLGETKGNLSDVTKSPSLDVMGNYVKDEEMSPQQQQDIINAAGTSVGNKNASAMEDNVRRANAAGIGALGQEAMAGRMTRQAESDAADAETNARIGASNAAAGRLQTAQGTVLGAAQTKAGMQEQAGEYEGTQGLSALQNTEQMRLGSQEDISSRELQAAEESGRENIANAQAETGQTQQVLANQTQLGTQTVQQAEAAAANRAATVAGNRQQTQQGVNQQNYQRGASANQALSTRYGQTGGARMSQQQAGAGLEQGQEQIASQNMNTAGNQQVSTFGATTGAENTAANVESGAQNQPGLGERIFGGVLGAASSAAKFMGDGGIVTEPTEATIGESGPEEVIPLGGQDADDDSGGGARKTAGEIGDVAGGFMRGFSKGPAGLAPGQQPLKARYGQVSSQIPGQKAPRRPLGSMMPPTPGQPDPMGGDDQDDDDSSLPSTSGSGYASGGIVNEPTETTLGEDGPEAVVSLDDMGDTKPPEDRSYLDKAKDFLFGSAALKKAAGPTPAPAQTGGAPAYSQSEMARMNQQAADRARAAKVIPISKPKSALRARYGSTPTRRAVGQ